MNRILAVVVLGGGAMSTLFGTPCWDLGDSCGSAPLCGPGEPGPGYSSTPCNHIYCDDGQTCGWDSSKKKMMRKDRTLYLWTEGEAVKTCVSAGPPPEWYGENCCLCNQAGTIYPAQ